MPQYELVVFFPSFYFNGEGMNPRCLSKTWQLFTVKRAAGGCKKKKQQSKERKRRHVCFEQTETRGVCLRADMTDATCGSLVFAWL